MSPDCDGQPRLSSTKKQQSPAERKQTLARRKHLAMYLSPIPQQSRHARDADEESKSLEAYKSGCGSLDQSQLLNVFQSPVPRLLKQNEDPKILVVNGSDHSLQSSSSYDSFCGGQKRYQEKYYAMKRENRRLYALVDKLERRIQQLVSQ